jgi:glycosyltransferase involved in cell wall biosynthesis
VTNKLRSPVTAFLVLKLGAPTVNMLQLPVLRGRPDADRRAAPAAPRRRPSVSLPVPMRNEAARLAASIPAMLAQDADEVIFLDDESTDGTGPLARSLLSKHSCARIENGVLAPQGWVGKSWACHQLAAKASGSLLVFCDADVLLAGGALDAVVAEMQAQRAAGPLVACALHGNHSWKGRVYP